MQSTISNAYTAPLLFLKLTPKTDSLTIIKIHIEIICVSTKLLQIKGLVTLYMSTCCGRAVRPFRMGGEHLQAESRSVYTDSRSHRATFVLSPHTDSINLDADMRPLITRVHSLTHT